MCGIVGYVQTKILAVEVDDQYKQALAELLYIDSLRGMDSTGVACIPKDRRFKPLLLKKAVPGFEFVNLDEYEAVQEAQANPGIFIGHNRAATRGSVTDANAHPFVAKHITLVHNGSIINHWSLNSGLSHLDPGAQVDSCHIAHAIAREGAEKTLANLDGPAALVWHDSKENSMNIALTEGRSIRWIFDIHGTCWFASEREMLWAVLVRNRIEVKDPKGGFIMMPEYSHFKWELGGEGDELPGKLTKTTIPKFVPLWKQQQLKWERERQEDIAKGGPNLGEAISTQKLLCSSTSSKGTDTQTGNSASVRKNEPISKNAINKMDKKLAEYQLATGDEIPVQKLSFCDNKDDKNLIDITCIWPEKQIKVILPECHRSYWDRSFNGRYQVCVYSIVQELAPKQGRHYPCLYAKPKLYPMKDLVQGPGNVLISKEDYAYAAKNGCNYCGNPVFVAHHEDTEWANGKPLCLQCSTNLNNDQRLVH